MVGTRSRRDSSASRSSIGGKDTKSSSDACCDVGGGVPSTLNAANNDVSCDRKFIIAKGQLCAGSIHRLRHPRSGAAALYHIAGAETSELLRIGADRRSMFYGESVVEDGSILLFSSVHPLFLVIHHLRVQAQHCFLSVEDLLEDEEYPALRLLADSQKLRKSLKLATDFKELEGVAYYRYNEDKLLDWLVRRFEILRTSISKHSDLDPAMSTDNNQRYVFGVLCEGLPVELVTPLKIRLDVKDAQMFLAPQKMPVVIAKRKPNDENVIPAKKANAPTSKKALAATKGTKSITAFFSKIT